MICLDHGAPAAPIRDDSEEKQASALLRLAIEGETMAFEELYLRYGTRMVHWARAEVRTPEDAEDAAQDAWVSLWRALPTLEMRQSGAISLLYVFARRAGRELRTRRFAVKRGGPDPSIHDEELLAHMHDLHRHQRGGNTVEQTPRSSTNRRDRYIATTERLMGQIPPEYVSLLDLVYCKEQKPEDIARQRGIRVSDAVASIHSGLSVARHLAAKDMQEAATDEEEAA